MITHIYTAGGEWIVASSKQEALDLWKAFYGIDLDDETDDETVDDVDELDDDSPLTLTDCETREAETKTCAEWISENKDWYEGDGILASESMC